MLRVESLERLHEPEPGDLHQVVEGLAPVHEAACDVARDPEVVLDELVAQSEVAGRVVLGEALVGSALLGHEQLSSRSS